MWLLDPTGAFAPTRFTEDLPTIDGAAPPQAAPTDEAVVVTFAGTADGRGFSTCRKLRAAGYVGRIYAAGPLVPDQAREAFQCGFDGIVVGDDQVGRHGRAAWERALTVAPDALYARSASGSAASIWHKRHAV